MHTCYSKGLSRSDRLGHPLPWHPTRPHISYKVQCLCERVCVCVCVHVLQCTIIEACQHTHNVTSTEPIDGFACKPQDHNSRSAWCHHEVEVLGACLFSHDNSESLPILAGSTEKCFIGPALLSCSEKIYVCRSTHNVRWQVHAC